jgi:TRAP-type C4-dicarboxylate transport system permease small subunit
VAIDMVVILLPRTLATILVLILMAQSALLLVIGLDIAWTQTTGIGGRFATDSLWLWNPFGEARWFKVPKGWMMASMVVGLFLLLLVAVELFLRNLVTLLGGHDGLREIPETIVLGAE